MPKRRPRPLVYIDACCFGQLIARVADLEARDAMQALLAEIEHNQVRFLDSSWLDTELRAAEPASLRRKLLAAVPKGTAYVPWTASIGKEARELAFALGMAGDGLWQLS